MKYLPWLLVAVLLLTGYVGRGHYSERIAQLEAKKAQVDTVYVTDTLRLTKVRYKTDSVLIAQVDTFMRVDTVRLLIAAERNACDAVISTCEQRVAVRDTLITELKKKKLLSHLPWVALGLLLGEAF